MGILERNIMTISTLTIRQALDLMGSEATDGEAAALITILQSSSHEDTRDISDADWCAMMARAIEAAAQPKAVAS